VIVAQVLNQKIVDWDEYTGRFQAIDTVEVRPRVSGYIDRVLFREGQAVTKGETLIVIDGHLPGLAQGCTPTATSLIAVYKALGGGWLAP
jgi:multidrug efflux pump subunit AcrA (membrane-fusion protein)